MQSIKRRVRPALFSRALHEQQPTRQLCATCLARRPQARPQQPRVVRYAPPRYSSASTSTTQPKESIGPQNHYELFPETLGANAIPPSGSFGIDVKLIRREFLQLQAKAHPDRMPQDRKRQAEGLSARINEAYKTLCDPLLRAQYLLGLRGVDTEDETAKVDDPTLLLEVLNTREVIEEAETESDLEPVRLENEARIADSVAVLDAAFQNDDLSRAKAESIKLRYWVNIRDCIAAWEKGKPVVMIH